MKIGKPEISYLKEKILKHTGASSNKVLLGPKIGADAALLKTSKLIAFHSDPITGARRNIGKLAIIIASNDIVASGARPKFATLCTFLPLDSKIEEAEQIQIQASEQAKEMGIAIVGGHVEFTPSVKNPIVVTSMIGEMIGEYQLRFREIENIRNNPSDYVLIQVKPAALESTSIIANDYEEKISQKFRREEIEEAKALIEKVSIYEEGILLYEKNLIVNAHDPTEGGILTAIKEIADFLNVGLEVYEEKIIILDISKRILGELGLDPLRSLSSGCIICVAKKNKANQILEMMRERNVASSVIGFLRKEGKILILPNGARVDLDEIEEKEEMWKLFGFNF